MLKNPSFNVISFASRKALSCSIGTLSILMLQAASFFRTFMVVSQVISLSLLSGRFAEIETLNGKKTEMSSADNMRFSRLKLAFSVSKDILPFTIFTASGRNKSPKDGFLNESRFYLEVDFLSCHLLI